MINPMGPGWQGKLWLHRGDVDRHDRWARSLGGLVGLHGDAERAEGLRGGGCNEPARARVQDPASAPLLRDHLSQEATGERVIDHLVLERGLALRVED